MPMKMLACCKFGAPSMEEEETWKLIAGSKAAGKKRKKPVPNAKCLNNAEEQKVEDNAADWDRSLVTGATGYIAGHLVKQLLSRGEKVRGTVRCLQNAGTVFLNSSTLNFRVQGNLHICVHLKEQMNALNW